MSPRSGAPRAAALTPDHRPALAPPGGDSLSAALEGVVTRYQNLLRHVALRHGVPTSDVHEVVQDVRVRLWRARPDSETISSLGVSYVYRTAMSAALDVVRRHRGIGGAGRETGFEEAGQEPVTQVTGGPEQVLARAEVARAVAEEVQALAEARRVAVQLHLAGYSRDDIAEILGWSKAKARNLIYRGLADLRAALGRRGVGPEELA